MFEALDEDDYTFVSFVQLKPIGGFLHYLIIVMSYFNCYCLNFNAKAQRTQRFAEKYKIIIY